MSEMVDHQYLKENCKLQCYAIESQQIHVEIGPTENVAVATTHKSVCKKHS